MAVMKHVNETVFQKTLALSDFYFGSDDWDYPLGLIQMCATTHTSEQMQAARNSPKWLEWLPGHAVRARLARHSMDFWLQAEDLPHPDNRVYYKRSAQVHLDLTSRPTRRRLTRLKSKAEGRAVARSVGPPFSSNSSLYLRQGRYARRYRASGRHLPLRHRSDATSVLNLDCRAHEIDNLYVTDASFFPFDRRSQSDANDHR